MFPAEAAWRHRGAREGFEVVIITSTGDGVRARGTTAAVEDGVGWVVGYDLVLDPDGLTRRAEVTSRSALGLRTILLEHDGAGAWTIDGSPAARLDGCVTSTWNHRR